MGIRCDQPMGLSDGAHKLLNSAPEVLKYVETVIREYPAPSLRKEETTRDVKSRYEVEDTDEGYYGMFGDVYKFRRYILTDGRRYVEYMQADPWSSGPCFFLALKDESTGKVVEESLWSDEEINNC